MKWDPEGRWLIRWWDVCNFLKELAGVWKGLAWLVGAIALAQILSLPYFQPKEAWPDWLLMCSIGIIIVAAIAWPRHRKITLAKAMDEHRGLKGEEQRLEQTLRMAEKEEWGLETRDRIARQLADAKRETERYLHATVTIKS